MRNVHYLSAVLGLLAASDPHVAHSVARQQEQEREATRLVHELQAAGLDAMKIHAEAGSMSEFIRLAPLHLQAIELSRTTCLSFDEAFAQLRRTLIHSEAATADRLAINLDMLHGLSRRRRELLRPFARPDVSVFIEHTPRSAEHRATQKQRQKDKRRRKARKGW